MSRQRKVEVASSFPLSLPEFAMTLPSVEDCTGSRGIKRDLLHALDHLLRDMLAATQHRARELNLVEEEIESACVTVMMTVAASAALATADGPENVTDAHFTAIAREALVSAKRRLRSKVERLH
jgi:hypothetical protein